MHDRRFRAMGSDCHVVVHGADAALLDVAVARIDELERRWSRFRSDSEISRLNAEAGTAVEVSADTVALVERAVEGWRFTGGTYDPTVLGDVLRAGYDRSFELLGDGAGAIGGASVGSDLVVACTDIAIDGHRVTIPRGTGFDPGGIGKGLAADLVATELVAAGAVGASVSMGGDVRVAGEGPDGAGWTIDVRHAAQDGPLVRVGVRDGGVVTSTTLLRRWTTDGQARHHLIDPRTGAPAVTDIEHVTVIAGSAWAAEVLAKAVLIRGSEHPWDLVDGSGAQALIVTTDGDVRASSGFAAFCGGVPVPTRLGHSDRTP